MTCECEHFCALFKILTYGIVGGKPELKAASSLGVRLLL
jgi:hypothetical protein